MLWQIVPATGVLESEELPRVFALEQNSPNPFNLSTAIKYELPISSMVNSSVYGILGREVSVLVNEMRDAGVHEVKVDGSGLASGVYLYGLRVRGSDSASPRDSRSRAVSFDQTRKLLLLQ